MTIPDKLNAIRIQGIEFQATPLADALTFLRQRSYAADPDVENPAQWGVPIAWLVDDLTASELRVTLTFQDCTLLNALHVTATAAGLGVYLNSSGVFILPVVCGHQLDALRDEAQKARIRQMGTPPAAHIPGLPRPGYDPVAACRAVLARVRQRLGL